jgi:SpoIIAA-like
MVERIEDMPDGTIGFRATGKLTKADYEQVLMPPLRELVEAEKEIRLLFVASDEVEQLELSAVGADIKAGWDLGARHMSLWRRTAMVTDLAWLTKAARAFGWLAPGELRVFGVGQLSEATEWVAG